MTTKSLNIVGGPSKWDLMLAIFDRYEDEDPREVMFLVEDWEADDPKKRTVNVHVTIPSIRQEHGSCEAWNLDGRIVDGPKSVFTWVVRIAYDTKARKGKLELLGDGNPPEHETIDSHGFTIYKKAGRIVAVEEGSNIGGRKVKLGDMVVSNGRYAVDAGTKGIITEIYEPFTRGSTDILMVWFEGHTCETQMKFKDLQL